MPIAFSCQCGKVFRLKDEFAGKRAKCSGCGAVLRVPAAEPQPVFDAEIVKTPPPNKPSRPAFEVVEDAPTRPDAEDVTFEVVDDGPPPPRGPVTPPAPGWKNPKAVKERERGTGDDPPQRKKKRSRRNTETGDGTKRMLYILGGLALIGLAIGLAVAAWDRGRLYIGGIFVALAGVGALGKGITGQFGDDES